MPTSSHKGVLEIDHERGVIYFHSETTGTSILRIQNLPTPIPMPLVGEVLGGALVDHLPRTELLDVRMGSNYGVRSLPSGTSWDKR